MVGAMRQTWSNGRRRLTPTGRTSQTNDLGQYRMYGLPPGEYYVSATLRNTDIMILDAAMLGGGASGASGSTPSSGYAPTYFPGTTVAAGAQRVTVAIAQEAQNTDFALAPVRLARISGAVMTSEGKPLEGAMVSAVPAGRADVGMGMMNAGTSRTTKDGNFTLSSVAPGDYMLTVRSVRIMTSDGGDNTMMFRATIGGGDGGDGEAASLPLAVSGEDLSNVVIVTSKGATASGRMVFEGSSTPPALTGVRITAAPADMDNPLLGGGGAATAKEDGSFQLRGLSGRRLLRAGNLPPGWTLKAVRLNGDDVTDSGVEFKPGQDVSGLEIVATSKQTEISGTVTSSNGSPIKDYTVVVFSDDSQHWNLPHDPLGDGYAAGSGRPVPRPQPAAGKLQHHRRGLHRGWIVGRSGTPRTAQGTRQAHHARRRRDRKARSEAHRCSSDRGLRRQLFRSNNSAASSASVVLVGDGAVRRA